MDRKNIDNFLVKLKLSDFIDSRVIEVENDDGVKEKGIFIPVEINDLFITKRNTVIAWMFATRKFYEPIDGLTHYLKLKTSREHLQKLRDLGYEPPYLGGMKPSYIITDYQARKISREPKKVKIGEYE